MAWRTPRPKEPPVSTYVQPAILARPDFLVEFDADSSMLFDRYFGLKEALEALCARPVDLVTTGSLQNPYFVEAVNKSRQLVYAAEDAQAA